MNCFRSLLLVLILGIATTSNAQDQAIKRLSKPISWAQYTYEAPAGISADGYSDPGENPSVSLQELQTGVSFPLYFGQSFRLMSGLSFTWHYFDFTGVDLYNISTFDISIPVNLMIPINPKWMIMAVAAPGVHSDLKKVDYRDFKSAFLLLANYTYSEDLQISIGAAYSRIFGEDRFFPAAGLTWKPAAAWTIRLVFPKPAVIYALNDKLRFMIGAEPAGGEWNIQDPVINNNDNEEYTFEFKGWRVGGGAEYDVTGMWTVYLDAGSTFSRTYKIENDDNTILNSDANDTLSLRLGLQLKR
jgi:hypothetical protein